MKDFSLTKDDREFVEKCIRRKDFEWSQEFFLRVIEQPRNQMEVYWAVIALRDCGTEKSIPILKNLLYFPKQDVKACSILTIAQISGAVETQLYADALLDSKYRENGYALWAIWAVADSGAVKAVYFYINKNISNIRRDKLQIGTYGMGVEYLLKHLEGFDDSCRLLKKLVELREPSSTAEEELFLKVRTALTNRGIV